MGRRVVAIFASVPLITILVMFALLGVFPGSLVYRDPADSFLYTPTEWCAKTFNKVWMWAKEEKGNT